MIPAVPVQTAWIVDNAAQLELRLLADDGRFHRFSISKSTLSRLNSESAQALHRAQAKQ